MGLNVRSKKKRLNDEAKAEINKKVVLDSSLDEEEIDASDFETVTLWAKPIAKRKSGKITKGTVIKALYLSNGNKTVCARGIGVSRKTIDNYIKKDKDVAEAFKDAVMCSADFAENKLMEHVSRGNPWAIEMVLRYRSNFNDSAIESAKGADNKGAILEALESMLED